MPTLIRASARPRRIVRGHDVLGVLFVLALLLHASGCVVIQSHGPLIVDGNADAIGLPALVAVTDEDGKPKSMAKLAPIGPAASGSAAKHWSAKSPEDRALHLRFLWLDEAGVSDRRLLVQGEDRNPKTASKGKRFTYWLARRTGPGAFVHYRATKTVLARAKTSPHLASFRDTLELDKDRLVFDEVAVVSKAKEILAFFRSLDRTCWSPCARTQPSKDQRLFDAMRARFERQQAAASKSKPEPKPQPQVSLRRLLANAPGTDGAALAKSIRAVRLVVDDSRAAGSLDATIAGREATATLKRSGVLVDDAAFPVVRVRLAAVGRKKTSERSGGFGVSQELTAFALHAHVDLSLPTFLIRGERAWFGRTIVAAASVTAETPARVRPGWTKVLVDRAVRRLFESSIRDVKAGAPGPVPEQAVVARAFAAKRAPIPLQCGFDVRFARSIPGPRPALSYTNFYPAKKARDDFVGALRRAGLRAPKKAERRGVVRYTLTQDRVTNRVGKREVNLGVRAVFERIDVDVPDAIVLTAAARAHRIQRTTVLSYTASDVQFGTLPTLVEERKRILARGARVARQIRALTQ